MCVKVFGTMLCLCSSLQSPVQLTCSSTRFWLLNVEMFLFSLMSAFLSSFSSPLSPVLWELQLQLPAHSSSPCSHHPHTKGSQSLELFGSKQHTFIFSSN